MNTNTTTLWPTEAPDPLASDTGSQAASMCYYSHHTQPPRDPRGPWHDQRLPRLASRSWVGEPVPTHNRVTPNGL